MRLRVLSACLMASACYVGQPEEPEDEAPPPTPPAEMPEAPDAPPAEPVPEEPDAPEPEPPAEPGMPAEPETPAEPEAPEEPAPEAAIPSGPADAARFLMQASFGPTDEDVADVEALGFEGWIAAQAALPTSSSYVTRLRQMREPHWDEIMDLFWSSAMEADDQLRHRVAYALSKIVTVSMRHDFFHGRPDTYGAYMDMLQDQAFGNYEDLIREVSLSPAMGLYLSHLGNRKADPETGIEPDENYAREVMQLFTIGLVELNADGTERPQETYDTDDVRGLASIFTGLSWANTDFEYPNVDAIDRTVSMTGFSRFHESAPKQVLGRSVATGTDALAGVEAGLDVVLSHPNLAPFVSKQLIQHLVSSNPTPAYVARVARAFEAGRYTGAGGTAFGDGRRGDMTATIAAILLDPEARSEAAAARAGHGKLREPALRFLHLARAFRDDGGRVLSGEPDNTGALRYSENLDVLGMKPYASPSVFGWFRPGYVVPGGWTADQGLVAPEMQIASGSALTSYIEFMSAVIRGEIWGTAFFDLDWAPLYAMADDPEALLDRLDVMLTAGRMEPETRQRIADALALAVIDDQDTDRDRRFRTELALLMVVTSPEFAVQR